MNPHMYIFPGASIVEIKFRALVTLNDQNGQIKNFIDYLADVQGGYDNGKWDPTLSASQHGAATLNLIMPSGGVVDPGIVKYATSNGVQVIVSFTEQAASNEERMRVGKGRNLTMTQGIEVKSFFSSSSVLVDWDKR